MKKGFTLVELSIVLVIIGLLIGGILIGQSLIDSAKVNKAVSQIQQFDIAVQQFKSKYRVFPGDTDLAGTNKVNTTRLNNGFIDDIYTTSSTTYTRSFRGETQNFWPALQNMVGLKIEGMTTNIPFKSNFDFQLGPPILPSGANQNSPKFALGENTGIWPYSKRVPTQIGEQYVAYGAYAQEVIPAGNFYFFADFSPMEEANVDGIFPNSGYYFRHSIPQSLAMALDKKMDDGDPVKGNVLNGSWEVTPEADCMQHPNSTGYYVAKASTGLCAMMVRMNY